MRTPCAAIEPGGDAGAIERVLEQADIALRRPQEHRDLVERDASSGLLENAARDLHALASFTGSGEERDVAASIADRWLARGEQVPPQRDQVGVPFLFVNLRFEADRL